MAFALIVLALGSVLAGYIGVPHALGGHNAAGDVAGAGVHRGRARGDDAGRRAGGRPPQAPAEEAAAEGAEAQTRRRSS